MSGKALIAVVALLVAGGIAAGFNAMDLGGSTPAPAVSEPPGNRWSVPVTMGEYGYDTGALSALPPGLAAFEVVSSGRRPHELQMFKLKEGNDFVRFVDVATGTGFGPELLEVASPVGGVGAGGGLAPGESQRFTVDLELGSYAFVSFVNGDHLKGMVKKFDILEATRVPVGEPVSEGTISMGDTDFELPAEGLTAGIYTLVNEGEQVHEAAIFELTGTKADLLKELKKGKDDSGVGGFSLLAPGRSSFAQLNLPAGSYAFVCRVRDEGSKRFHFEQGMLQPFQVL